ncbi:hypothetical protein [Agromyces aureus]|uniref:Uncharacterized protein n=1 Tax=Agromyces aureus TaxID=453304 RepID=A0A191WCC2_9MICO|nr:hypothetical protein [Agromyces aureus]ANJ25910.1 hypothetical protein ATC03_03295 [Agromyces aureus]
MTRRLRVVRATAALAAAAMMIGGAAVIAPTTAAWVDQTSFRADTSSLTTFVPDPDTSHDAIAVSPGLTYSVTDPVQSPNDANVCVLSMTVTNTTDEPLAWWVEFDVDRPPLWGLDPTVPGAFGTSRIRTISFDAATGVWRIGGAVGDIDILAPGATVVGSASGGIGYCSLTSGPQLPDDPALYEVEGSKFDSPFEYCITIDVATDYPWAIVWSTRVDLLDFYTEAELAGLTSYSVSQVVATPVPGESYTFDIVGAASTRMIAGPWALNGGAGARVIERAVCAKSPSLPDGS